MARRPVERRPVSDCPCGSGNSYRACCGRFHAGAVAPTAELLMRSRFSAFALGDAAYLLRTWDPVTRPVLLDLDEAIRWKRLQIIRASETTVEFAASYVAGGQPGTLRELSSFRRYDGEWLYVGPVD